MLLYDRMIKLANDERRFARAEQHTKTQIGIMRNAQVIIIDNVAKYFYEDSSKELWLDNDFPNIAPPFEEFWMEFENPRFSNSEGNIIKYARWFSDGITGALFKAISIDNMPMEVRQKTLSQFANAKWGLAIALFMELKGEIIERGSASLLIDYEGKIITKSKYGHISQKSASLSGSHNPDDVVAGIYSQIEPCFLALSFMHCKNVTIKKKAIPKGLIHKAQKKHGYIPVRYHVLDIEPMKKVLRYEGNAEKTGLKMALHICRGHFKDYSKGGGLFGKYQGLYWWESHVRGSIGQGVVIKDYNVNPPIGNMTQ